MVLTHRFGVFFKKNSNNNNNANDINDFKIFESNQNDLVFVATDFTFLAEIILIFEVF